MTDDSFPITEIGTVPIRYHSSTYRVSITDAVERAGLEDGGAFIFDPDAIDELGGLLPALGTENKADGRRSKFGRSIAVEGNEQRRVFRIAIPPEALEELGYDLDEVRAADEEDNPLGITVHAGPELLAFERPSEQTISVDRDHFDEQAKPRTESADGDGQ